MERTKILVVDDNERNRYLVSFILEKNGFEVVTANDGLEGVETAREQRVNLIIMDIKMPKMDGYEATIRIKKLEGYQSVPIIALTSYAMAGDKKKAVAAGCDGYIAKPINPETFMDEIRRFLEVIK
uniref:Chemotaxis protein CheY n=1 Tax=Candidatus Methanogaster sp. ANME-2c ERB4 TaxID=2759911 RepID=A0A7G9YEV9_9EURY|nr:chemotaxis protein CheY [Methanosarcinales archaeon ANME-2c ERB4]